MFSRGAPRTGLRRPGGCFADQYHFGTHEFFDLCQMLGAEPYVWGNLGSGTVQEMEQWVEYRTFEGKSPMADLRRQNGRQQPWKRRYFGVGNENWGGGGNLRAEYYADEYRRYGTFVATTAQTRSTRAPAAPTATTIPGPRC